MCLGSIFVINIGSIGTNRVNKPTTGRYHNTPPLLIVSLSLSLLCRHFPGHPREEERGQSSTVMCTNW